MFERKDEITIVICGAAGQGIQTVEHFITRVLKSAGYNVYSTKEYMSRVRGGINSTEIRVSSKKVCSFAKSIDLIIPLKKEAVPHLEKRYNVTAETFYLGEKEVLDGVNSDKKIEIEFNKIADEIGGRIYSNIIGAGMISGLFGVEFNIIENYLKKRFSGKGEQILKNNYLAVKKGMDVAKKLLDSGKIKITINRDEKVTNQIILDGTEAVGLGAIAGGVNFICAYPMSPSTGVITFLSSNSKEFDIVVEQAEDEIAAMNAVIGSWYVGGRGIVTTSGGGLALMSEALSLAGVSESPLVIHLAQRPGPATGLPTRTIQSDIDLALYAGHGFFPRIILAPGDIVDAFYLTQKAFNLASKFQVPVFILTDQYFVSTYYNVPKFDLSNITIEDHITKAKEGYKRYKLTEDGISPRGIPGDTDVLIPLDSHTHDEEGHISEDLEYIRIEMVNKRFNKLESMKKEVIPPELIGRENYKVLIIGWGSTYHMIKDAIEKIGRDDISFLYFKQVYPIYPQLTKYLNKAEKVINIETNATAQFARLIQLETDYKIKHNILKSNGMSFFTEELVERITEELNK